MNDPIIHPLYPPHPKPLADREAMDLETMALLRQMVANQKQIIDLLSDIAMGLA